MMLLVFMSSAKSGINAEVGEWEVLLDCRESVLLMFCESGVDNPVPKPGISEFEAMDPVQQGS
jgi:hypothetical protein